MSFTVKIGSSTLLGLFLLGLSLGIKPAQAQDSDNGDFLFWSQTQFYYNSKDTPKFSFYLETKTRANNNASAFMEFQGNPGFYYQFFPWFSLGYLNAMVVPNNGTFEYRPTIDAKLSKSVGKWNFYSRNRFENRLKNNYRFRYRLRGTIAYFVKGRRVNFQPYIENEIFLQSTNGFEQNRASIGNQFIFLNGRIGWSLYYMVRSDKRRSGWIHRHVLGHIIKFYFP